MPPAKRSGRGAPVTEPVTEQVTIEQAERARAVLEAHRKQQRQQKQRKMEASKKIVIWAAVIATAAFVVPIVLAFLALQTLEQFFGTVFCACIAEVGIYSAKSWAEKNSRNKYNIDEDGNPRDIGG